MKRPVGHADADHNEFGSSAPASFASSSIFPLTDFKLIIDTDVVRTSIAHSANKANAGVLFYPLQAQSDWASSTDRRTTGDG